MERIPETRQRTRTDWRPVSGEASGRWDLWSVASRRVPADSHALVAECARASAEAARPLVAADLREAVAEACEVPPSQAWAGLTGALRAVVEAEVRRRVPGDRCRDLDFEPETTPEATALVAQPFWLATFRYGADAHHFLCDGTDLARHHGTRPVDRAREAALAALWRPVKIAAIAWAVAAVLGLFLFVVPGVIAAVLGIAHVAWLASRARAARRALVERSREVRRRALARRDGAAG